MEPMEGLHSEGGKRERREREREKKKTPKINTAPPSGLRLNGRGKEKEKHWSETD